VLVRPVYGQHLKQILNHDGRHVIGEELIKVVGAGAAPAAVARGLARSLLIGLGGDQAAIGKSHRVLAGRDRPGRVDLDAVHANRTKIGLLVRAGVQDRESGREASATAIRRCSSACFHRRLRRLAGLGGVMWGLFQQT